ncbi:MAG TPA: transposase, partial [Phnomibacter sp.]|nr:transposase [Phnomibacter sp.]
DRIVPIYNRCFAGRDSRPPINGRGIIGALIIKHLEALLDRATLQHITENVYMQYFLRYSGFTDEAPFTAPLFVELRKRMSVELTNKISELVALHALVGRDSEKEEDTNAKPPSDDNDTPALAAGNAEVSMDTGVPEQVAEPAPQGKLLWMPL